ncbi:TPA: LPS O-antigen length regulator [Vibrio vulnificus]|nr:LPS O-antigen length regulator [Vibrio vulnificus]HDY7748137.1 LPS O-antigen length regulator [Vibrio vulnificus]HDY7756446.1 LPS O-antigen length regulator [Vibrio vulnificus]HDY7760863.1 LPS O-antigen length regulator [Vibrio vulnificus]HDY7769986.1 LPS O-antigen length regulator [Vibrio vulnificus]
MESQKEPNPHYLPSPPNPHSTEDEIDLRELLKALWSGKWLIISITFVFTVGSVFYALSLPNIYKSDALLAPAESSNGGSLSKMAGQLGGLAALAGVNFSGGESSQTDLAIQVMKSRQFIGNFINNHNLLVPLMAAKGWDAEKNQLIIDEEIYNERENKWLRKPKGLRGSKPTEQEAIEVFKKDIFSVTQDKETGLYTVSVDHYSPFVAQMWVNWLIDDINQVMRNRAIAEATQNLKYLGEQLEKTAVAEMQSTFYKLIEEQTKSLMLAEVQEEFVFKIIDPAVVSENKVKPNRVMVIILGLLLGTIFGVAILLIKYAFFSKNRN